MASAIALGGLLSPDSMLFPPRFSVSCLGGGWFGSGPPSMNAPVDVVGAAARIHVKLGAPAIHLPLDVAVLDLREEMHAAGLQVQIAGNEPAEVRRMRHATAWAAHRREQ